MPHCPHCGATLVQLGRLYLASRDPGLLAKFAALAGRLHGPARGYELGLRLLSARLLRGMC